MQGKNKRNGKKVQMTNFLKDHLKERVIEVLADFSSAKKDR